MIFIKLLEISEQHQVDLKEILADTKKLNKKFDTELDRVGNREKDEPGEETADSYDPSSDSLSADTADFPRAEVIEAIPMPKWGIPDHHRIFMSHIERLNLSLRMEIRRLTRLTNAFSKKWENLKATYALWFAWYNFCRVHQTLRVAPAMEAQITDHIWSVEELLSFGSSQEAKTA